MMTAQSAHPWIARFSIYAMRQLPWISARTAIQQAVARYPYCADQTPEVAAQSLVTAAKDTRATRPSRTAPIGGSR